jgi:adenine phosphoribosyltransferase
MTDWLRGQILSQFRWVEGHADVWRLFANASTLTALIDGLAAPWREAEVTKVCGIEARGFVLGAPVAARLGVGFVAIRKEGGLFPGPKLELRAEADYRGLRPLLRVQRDNLQSDDRVVLVDDWAERGAQAAAARHLIEQCGATFLGLSLVVDQLSDDVRAGLGRVEAILRYEELPLSTRPSD